MGPSSLTTRLLLAVVGLALLAFGIFAWLQVISIFLGAIQGAWFVRTSALSWVSTLASLATPFLGAFLLWRVVHGRPRRRSR